PSALALAPDGSLYIAEAVYVRTARIRRLAPDGTLSTIAGGEEPGFSGDGGPAIKAKLSDPTGLAFTSDGTLYIADQGNHCIRRITPDGIITTIADQGGKQTEGYSGDGGPALKARLYWP